MTDFSSRPHARDYVSGLAMSGRYHFTSEDARDALGVSSEASRRALGRLSEKGLIAQPARGFYVIVPPEYRRIGCLPSEQFVPELMASLQQPYYVGLLSAAQYHGAAHQRPQVYQVMVQKARRPLRCGVARVRFYVRNRLREVSVQSINTPRGTVLFSTPEATALDIVGYQRRVGGLNHVATVLVELAEQLNPLRLLAAARVGPVAWVQRLGYLLDLVGAGDRAVPLQFYVEEHARQYSRLLPRVHRDGASRDPKWKLFVNTEIEADI